MEITGVGREERLARLFAAEENEAVLFMEMVCKGAINPRGE